MDCFEELQKAFETNANPDDSAPMERYMKNHFRFLGLKSPVRKDLQKEFIKKAKLLPDKEFVDLIRLLWNQPYREYQYTACDLLDRNKKKIPLNYVTEFEWLITTKSWWDSVDGIVPRSLGYYFLNYPEQIEKHIPRWVSQKNIWLQRAAILFQLKYKEKTNTELLFEVILELMNTNEFFVNKAIGWALREYSKTNPKEVAIFVAANKLSNLSRREALKVINLKSNL